MMNTQRRSAAREAFEALALAKNPTSALLHRTCSAFVDMVAEIEQQRVELRIGGFLIARGQDRDAA
jgi:hypothetical protein